MRTEYSVRWCYNIINKTSYLVLFLIIVLIVIPLSASSLDETQPYHGLTVNKPSKDAEITSSGSMDWNRGADYRLTFGYNNYSDYALRFLVQFDLPSTISGENIISATLKLYGPNPFSSGSPSGEVLRACRVTHDWVEGTGKLGAQTQDGVTWNEYNYSDGPISATNNWDSSGGDYTLEDSSTVVIPSYPMTWTFLNWTVTDIVKAWASKDYPNYGFLLMLDDESGDYKGGVFNSREYAEEYGEWAAPKLEITYMSPSIESCTSEGDQRDSFESGEAVYVYGDGYPPDTTYEIFIVGDEEVWTDGMPLPERVADTAFTISSDTDGVVSPTAVWNDPQTFGKYDIVVDINRNDHYDVEIDVLDDNDVEVTAGILCVRAQTGVQAFPIGILIGAIIVAAIAVAITLYYLRRKKES
ncbi:MAG: DNRLRE domain-containing protein [Thermoproteota archaeon]